MRTTLHKSLSLVLAMVVVIATFVIQPFTAEAAVDLKAKTAILVDANSGDILYEKNADKKLPPASMTKIMTEYLVWEAIDKGQISWDDTTQISDYAYSISANDDFSGVGLKQNKDYTVKELYKAMAINSDNATTIALAEKIAGSEGDFVKKMNKKGKEMGLSDFKFVNSSGLANKDLGDNYPKGTKADDDNLMSARASAQLAYHLVKDYPEALDISKVPQAKFEDQSITNWNWMLKHDEKNASSLKQFYYKGMDGLKTGHTNAAGYSFTGTAQRDGKRLISVVMKTKSEQARFKQTATLLDYGFDNFKTKELFPKAYQLKDNKSLPVKKGKADSVDIATKQAVKASVKNGDEKEYKLTYHLDKDKLNKKGELVAPVKKGEKVGTAEVTYSGKDDYGQITNQDKHDTVDVVATDSVDKKNWFMLMLSAIGSFFSNIFSSITDVIKSWF